MGTVNHVQQGEGGEQGDPLMPLLFALGQHSALAAVSERLHVGELLFAFHDDLYIKCSPDRAVECSHILRQMLWQHCRISLNNGKTRLWNRAGLFPRDCEILENAARLVDPDAVVWKGDPDLPLSQQGIKILGVPVGRTEFVEHELDSRATCHAELLEKIPFVEDLQCAWLILLYCGCPGRTSSVALLAQIVHCNSPRDTRRKSGDALPLWSACCQRQFQNPPGPLPRCLCLQDGWGAAAVSD